MRHPSMSHMYLNLFNESIAGLVGLPNVGKSTLFNALLSKQIADAANYPFCTIDPNVGVVEVPDDRLPKLAEVVQSQKLVPAAIEFVDIAGLVKGAHKGEGLGNQFLAHIREVDTIVMVIRDFESENIVRAGSVNPVDDVQTLLTELQLADLQTIEKQQPPRPNAEKEEKVRWDVTLKIKSQLESGQCVDIMTFSDEQLQEVKSLNLLTIKPIIIVLNTDENELNKSVTDVLNYPTFRISAKLEADMAGLNRMERLELLQAYGISEPGLDQLIKITYATLGLITFLTAGEKEVRAWPIHKGTEAPQAAGTIHTDFEKAFIKAQISNYDDFVNLGGWKNLKETGKVRFEGKEYVMQENDVVEFMVNT